MGTKNLKQGLTAHDQIYRGTWPKIGGTPNLATPYFFSWCRPSRYLCKADFNISISEKNPLLLLLLQVECLQVVCDWPSFCYFCKICWANTDVWKTAPIPLTHVPLLFVGYVVFDDLWLWYSVYDFLLIIVIHFCHTSYVIVAIKWIAKICLSLRSYSVA